MRRHPNGRSYFIANEENWCSKVLLYTWKYDGVDVGLNSFNQDDDIRIYPVPAKDVLNIRLENEEEATATLYSLDGKAVLRKNITGNDAVNVSRLSTGTYILQVLTRSKAIRRTIIIQ